MIISQSTEGPAGMQHKGCEASMEASLALYALTPATATHVCNVQQEKLRILDTK